MTTQEILQLLDEKRVLTAPAAVAWDEVQRQLRSNILYL